MLKQIFCGFSITAIIAMTSCKEIPVAIATDEGASDTSYTTSVEQPQARMVLAEEFTGASCVNCPEGAAILHEMDSTGSFANKINIVSIHSGALSRPITPDKNPDLFSVQDFRTEDGDQIAKNIFGGIAAQPIAAFDRLPNGSSAYQYLMDGPNDGGSNWKNMVSKSLEQFPNTPVNISISNTTKGENTFEIEVKVAYTQGLDDRQALTVYLIENGITDIQEYSSGESYREYTFEHVFRKAISPYNGKEILPGKDKTAGLVYIQRYLFSIDPNDAKQKFWKPENMQVVAFVHKTGTDDKQVYQSQVAKLIP